MPWNQPIVSGQTHDYLLHHGKCQRAFHRCGNILPRSSLGDHLKVLGAFDYMALDFLT